MFRTCGVALLSFCVTLLWPSTVSFLPDWNSCQPKSCKHTQVSAPLPFDCGTLPAQCYEAKNLLRANKSIKAFYNEVPVIYNQTMLFCPSAKLTASEFDNWRIEFQKTQNIYAVLLWRISPLDEPEKMTVRVARRVSSYDKESTECKYLHQYDRYHYFYCYSSEKLTSDYRVGIEGHTLEIRGNFFIDDTKDFTKSVKVYSYPVRLCASPEAYEDQTLYPPSTHYLTGQEVEYKCQASKQLVGNSTRICKANGLWSGRAPVCVTVQKVVPSQYYLKYYNGSENEPKNGTYFPASNRHQALMLVPQQIVTFELQSEYCLKDVIIKYYTASYNFAAMHGKSDDKTRMVKYRRGDGENYVCAKEIVVERRNDTVISTFASAELILEVYGIGYEQIHYRCLNFSTFTSYRFEKIPERFTRNEENYALRCANGFKVEEDYPPKGPAVVKCKNGAWKGRLPNCKRNFCLLPESNKFSSWRLKENRDNESTLTEIEYKCDDGFELQGESSSACFNGKWTSAPPICQAIYCSSIAQMNKGRMMIIEGQVSELVIENDGMNMFYHHGVRLHFQCAPGFTLIGNETIECVNNSWTASAPMCREILCGMPPFRVAGHENTTIDVKSWSIGDHRFTCPEGFAISKSGTAEKIVSVKLHCQPSGRWLEELDDFECIKQSKGPTSNLIALITSVAVIAVTIAGIICYISIKRKKQRNKVIPVFLDELSTPTTELNEHLVQSSHMLVTNKGEHRHLLLKNVE